MIRPLALLLALSAPAAAQTLGPCTGGALWWAIPGAAGYGPCESPQEGFFLLSCGQNTVLLEVESPYEIAEGTPGALTLSVDGRDWRLDGTGTAYPRTGVVGLGAIAIPRDAIEGLMAGASARFDLPTERRDVHLTGSANAIATMLTGCEGA
ncbi:MAG: hypothetical protein AAGE03_05370 [Pseudomonadota bacterium]